MHELVHVPRWDPTLFAMPREMQKLAVRVRDEHIEFLYPTLDWIGWTSTDGTHRGEFRTYGIGVLDATSAPVAIQVFSSWLSMFEAAPDPVILPTSVDLDTEEWSYWQGSPQELVDSLRKLVAWCRRVASGDGIIVHFGI